MQSQPDLHIYLAVKDNSVAPFARWGLQFYSFKEKKYIVLVLIWAKKLSADRLITRTAPS